MKAHVQFYIDGDLVGLIPKKILKEISEKAILQAQRALVEYAFKSTQPGSDLNQANLRDSYFHKDEIKIIQKKDMSISTYCETTSNLMTQNHQSKTENNQYVSLKEKFSELFQQFLEDCGQSPTKHHESRLSEKLLQLKVEIDCTHRGAQPLRSVSDQKITSERNLHKTLEKILSACVCPCREEKNQERVLSESSGPCESLYEKHKDNI